MKLLILTQKIDEGDAVLGFFHGWLKEFAKHFEHVSVICLGKGQYQLPENVSIYSLGKEERVSKIIYLFRFYRYIWFLRKDYDVVFIHMNQEYMILGGLYWRLLGKRIFLWRNHAQGSFLTQMAVSLAHQVFCTSPHSYTAKFRKTVLMPAGIDTDFFQPNAMVARKPHSLLFLGRIAPVKKVLEFIEWFNSLDESYVATLAGGALPEDQNYEKLVRSHAPERVSFIGPVSQSEALKLYQSHETYVNFTPTGSLDKSILEAAACATRVIVKNADLKMLEKMTGEELRDFVVENHSLKKLMIKFSAIAHDRL